VALGDVAAGSRDPGGIDLVHQRLRVGVRAAMIWLSILLTLFLFVYLTAALLRPEWF
jgi:K+-transporting ATPase KdpF subunit